MRVRRLVLRKETLTELRPQELTLVAGAADAATLAYLDCLSRGVTDCLSDRLATCDSWLRPCISNTCTR